MNTGLFLVIDLPKLIVNVAWVTLSVILAIILYRLLLRRLKRGVMDNVDYVVLHRSEKEPAFGSIQLYFTAEVPGNAVFTIYEKNGDREWVLFEGDFKVGNTIINFDTTTVPNGWYYYEVKTDNQKTYKLLEIKNDI
jgi:hypothetical protein